MLEGKIKAIEKTQVVVLPEMFSTGFSMKPEQLAETMEGTTVQWMKRVAAEKKIILTGSVIIEEEGKYYNRLIWMLPNGQYGFYNKRHLFAFAGEDGHYTGGDQRARQQFDDENNFEYDLLMYVANWPQRRSTAWKALLQARAIENQCYVIGVNRIGDDGNGIYHSGDSMIIDPLGEVLYHKQDAEDVFTITLEKEKLEEVRQKFPFWKDADSFELFT